MVCLIPTLCDEDTGVVGVKFSTDIRSETAASRCFEDKVSKTSGLPRSPSPCEKRDRVDGIKKGMLGRFRVGNLAITGSTRHGSCDALRDDSCFNSV